MKWFFFFMLFFPLASTAIENSQQDLTGTSFLINKLDYLNQMLNPNYPGKKAIELRLAHALFLASEENKTKATQQNCSSCLQKSIDFSKRSLKLYQQLEPVLKSRHQLLYAESLFKQAYLERSLGNPSRSLSVLKKLAKIKNIDPLWQARAWYNIGEIEFELYRYKKALKAFDKVLKQKESPWRFASRYRKIWSLFNLSLYEESFQEFYSFLNSKDYSQEDYSKKNHSEKDLSLDNQNLKQKLQTEIEVLYSYIQITDQRLDFLYEFLKKSFTSPSQNESLRRIAGLAKMLKSLGRLKPSNQVWKFYLSKNPEPLDQLMAYSAFLENALSLDYKDKFLELGEVTNKLLALQNKLGTQKATTLILKRFFDDSQQNRQNFSKKQKLYLLSLYQQSHKLYPKDFDLLAKAGVLAKELQDYPLAMLYYQQAFQAIKEPPSLKEDFCLKQLEIAELSKTESLRLQAYDFYIKNGTQPDLVFKSKYQTAYIYYSQKKFKKAQLLFYSLAFYDLKKEDSSIKDLKLKSAHLSLSSLKELGNQEETLITQADQFRKAFATDKKEFTIIYNLAILNQVKKLLKAKDFSKQPVQASTDKNIKKAWELLIKFSVKEAQSKELLSYYTNLMLLSKELLKFKEMDRSIKFLLNQEKLTPEDLKMVLNWKIWLEELRLNFKEVLKTVQRLYPKDQSKEHLFRLALLLELAGESPALYYRKIIKKYPQHPRVTDLVVYILEQSDQKTQKKDLIQYARFFSQKPDELITLVLKADQGERDLDFMQSFLKLEFIKGSFLDRFLQTTQNIALFENHLKEVQKYSSNKNLKSTALKKYTQTINKLTKDTEELLKTTDWLSRFFIVSSLTKELEAFYNYVLQLPLPKNLNPQEQSEYKSLLKDEMKVYNNQIIFLNLRLKMLKSPAYIEKYKKTFQKNPVVQPYLSWELNKLFQIIDDENFKQTVKQTVFMDQSLVSDSAVDKPKPVSVQQVESLYQKLKTQPFDLGTLRLLLKIEQDRKNRAWSFYLSQRIKEIESKQRN